MSATTSSSVTPTNNATISPSPTNSTIFSRTMTATTSPNITVTPSPTATASNYTNATLTASLSYSPTGTLSVGASPSTSASKTVSVSQNASIQPSGTPFRSQSGTPSNSPKKGSTPGPPTDQPSNDSGLEWWAILLIVLAGLVVIGLLAGAGFFAFKKYKSRKNEFYVDNDGDI